ncbi:hypothetical protein C8Q80DRAFT_783167 [Daedaleopsis nitida]|nr:hypothetical protein C8Q80DRAFT_783167 [Daedaleopsis nitida]
MPDGADGFEFRDLCLNNCIIAVVANSFTTSECSLYALFRTGPLVIQAGQGTHDATRTDSLGPNAPNRRRRLRTIQDPHAHRTFSHHVCCLPGIPGISPCTTHPSMDGLTSCSHLICHFAGHIPLALRHSFYPDTPDLPSASRALLVGRTLGVGAMHSLIVHVRLSLDRNLNFSTDMWRQWISPSFTVLYNTKRQDTTLHDIFMTR